MRNASSHFGWAPSFSGIVLQRMRRYTLKHLIRLIVLPLSLWIGCSVALAAADMPTKIGVLDWQQLLAQAPQAKAAGERLEKEFQRPKDDLMAMQKKFVAQRDKFQRDKDVLSVTERAKKEKELQKLEADLRHKDEQLRSEYSTRHQEEMNNFITEVRAVVDELAKADKFDLILPQEATLFMADRIDVTDAVLSRLQKAKTSKPSTDKASDSKSDS